MITKRRFYLTAILLCAVLVLGAALTMHTYAGQDFAGGDGTEVNPWQIETAEQLDNVRKYLGDEHSDEHFILTAHIDLSGLVPWTPIGSFMHPSEDPFYGHFDGGEGYIIRNLQIPSVPSGSSRGLFGRTGEEAKLINVKLMDVNLSGTDNIGALVGWNKGAIENCYSTGTVSGKGRTGGLVGRNDSLGTIKNSHSEAEINNTWNNSGGLVGINIGSIIGSHAKGEVNSEHKWVGGLVGGNVGGIITDSWAEGNVYGNEQVGGLVGFNEVSGSGAGIIENSHAEGNVTGVGAAQDKIGGLVGYNWGTIFESHATGDVVGKILVGGLVGGSEWSGYTGKFAVVEECFATGSVEGENSVGGLAGFISGTGTIIQDSYANGAVNGSYYVGGLVGYNDRSVENSYATGAVTGTGYFVGGLVGYNDRSVENSYATGAVEGGFNVGGLVGYNNNTVRNSYAIGKVGGTDFVGGLVGSNFWDVINSYYNSQTSDQSDTGKGIPKTTQEMQSGTPSAEIYKDWSEDIWKFTPVDKYPWLDEPYTYDLPTVYIISVTIDPLASGQVTGAGTYANGEEVVLTATANPGYEFVKWAEGGAEVYSEPTYTFTAEDDRDLVANFSVSPTFIDVSPTMQFYPYIEAIYADGITTGYGDDTYRPNDTVTRGQMAAFLSRALELPDAGDPGNPSFTDVAPSMQFFGYIEAIYADGITTGYDDDTYRPNDTVTRGQKAAFLSRALELPDAGDPGNPSFTDVAPSMQFFGYIEAIYADGITTGYGDDTYRPNDTVTRGQMAAFLARALGLTD